MRAPERPWTLRNVRNGRLLADRLLHAFDSRSRRTGLLGREVFPEGHAMIIAPCSAVHTFFMRFPIDLLFITRPGLVAAVRHAVRPWRMAAAFRAYAVIELPAGTLARCDTRVGDTLVLVAEGDADGLSGHVQT